MSRVFNTAKQVWSTKSQVIHNLWLAGLGAYDQSFTTATATLSRSEVILEKLILRGKEVEEDASSSFKMNKQRLTDVRHEVQDNLQEKFHKTVTNITHIDTDKFDTILTKIEQVEIALAAVKAQKELEIEQEVISESKQIKSELQNMSAEVQVAQTVSKAEAVKPKVAKRTTAKKTRKAASKKKN